MHGTDALRAYIVFMGPFEANVNWTETGIKGVTRFLDRFWQLAQERGRREQPDNTMIAWPQPGNPAHAAFRRRQHRTVQRLTADMQAFRFNTAVAALMEWLNELLDTPAEAIPPAGWREAIATFCLLLAPIAPFVTEEVWQGVLGNRESVHRQAWPKWDEAIATADEVTIAVQVNGKLRATISVPVGSEEGTLREAALSDPNVWKYVNGKPIRRVIVAPDRLVNLVV
jgi:leucyl-tRNA synthetase